MITNIVPIDSQIVFASKLSPGDLLSWCLTSKKISELCDNDKFWFYKLDIDYPYMSEKRFDISNKEMFKRLTLGYGDLYHINPKTREYEFIKPNIRTIIRGISNNQFVIDIHNNLISVEYDKDYLGTPSDDYFYNKEKILRKNVKDLILKSTTNGYDLLLDKNGDLIAISDEDDNGLIKIDENVKSIGYNGYIKNNNDFYLLNDQDKPIKIMENVKQYIDVDHQIILTNDNIIYVRDEERETLKTIIEYKDDIHYITGLEHEDGTYLLAIIFSNGTSLTYLLDENFYILSELKINSKKLLAGSTSYYVISLDNILYEIVEKPTGHFKFLPIMNNILDYSPVRGYFISSMEPDILE